MLRICHTKGIMEAGLDEAGRGPLAGPVVAAAVILPPRFAPAGLNDSKKITEAKRDALRIIIEKKAVAWAIGIATPEEIDTVNIYHATFLAMHRALDALGRTPECLLIDGNRFKPYADIPYHCIIRGDGKYRSIAAASILAKTHRDEIMYRLHGEHPEYGWNVNKGYGTLFHRKQMQLHGPSPYHRLTFRSGINEVAVQDACSGAEGTEEVLLPC